MAMKRVKIFNELKEALEEIRDFELGKRNDLRVTEIPSPPTKKRRKKSTRSKLSQTHAD
jgi:hypothetical protein